MSWEEVVVSSKILGHISSGIYRSAGKALKELVSNAFDADARRVVITTNHPSFDIITCYDDGAGMTLDGFRRMMKGGIGESRKRIDKDVTPELGRPIIGRLGIGMLGIAQICHQFKVISHHRKTKTAFQATVQLIDYLGEKVDAIDPEDQEDREIDVGKFAIEELEYDPNQAGTYIVAADMRSAFVRKFRENPGSPLPSKFSSFLQTVQRERSVTELGDYWQMVWELATACPIPYIEEGPFLWGRIKSPPGFRKKFDRLKQSLNDYQFEVVVDGLSLRKPNHYPYPAHRANTKKSMTGQLFEIDKEMDVYGRPLNLFGYVYMQDGQAIEPMGVRGLLLRIRNVGIGGYDPTFLSYPKIEGPRFNWLSSEVYVEEGLEYALNIDRDSFNEMHPHFVSLQQTIHNLLPEVFLKASRGVKQRSMAKQQSAHKKTAKALQQFLTEELNSSYELVETEDGYMPLSIDFKKKQLLINTRSPLWPRAANKREFSQLAAVAFELSQQAPEPERREKFYKLLFDLLNL